MSYLRIYVSIKLSMCYLSHNRNLFQLNFHQPKISMFSQSCSVSSSKYFSNSSFYLPFFHIFVSSTYFSTSQFFCEATQTLSSLLVAKISSLCTSLNCELLYSLNDRNVISFNHKPQLTSTQYTKVYNRN